MLHHACGMGGVQWIDRRLAIALAVLVLAGCSTPEYKPVWQGNTSAGYSERQLALNRYQVSFVGSTTTAPADVEQGLMRRAAEVTLRAGYNHFVLNTRGLQRNRYRVPGFVPDTYLHGPNYAERVRAWSNYPEVWEGIEMRYTAQAEIQLLKPEEVAANPGAIAAVSVFEGSPPPFAVASLAW